MGTHSRFSATVSRAAGRVGLACLALALLVLAAQAPPAGAKRGDRDRDGLSDSKEKRIYKTNPRRRDTDRDRLRDGYEVKRSHTSPRRRDTDGDRLNDGYEVRRSHTDPTDPDTDGDRLRDGEEVKRWGTSPRHADTDLDGVTDFVEVLLGLNPLGPIPLRSPPAPAAASGSGSPGTPSPPPDTTPPETTIDAGPSGTVGTDDATFRFSSSEPGSSFECRLNSGVWTGCSSPRSHIGLSDGSHTFEVRATDSAGNVDPSPAARTWIVSVPPPSPPPAECTANVTPSTFAGAFASAGADAVICLASGSYGNFTGALKPATVTIRALPGATASMTIDFDPASNITLDGLRITDADFSDSRTKNITVRNSDIPGQVIFRTGFLANSNILFDNNVHRDWDTCSSCGEGRIWLPNDTSQPSGITIQNSEFRGGLSDGIQNGSNGTRIIGNVFHDLEQGTPSGVHTDAIQLYGSSNTLIRGNFFYSVPDAVMAPDGADHEVIEDNVFRGEPDGYPYAITLWSDDGSVVRHNTMADGACAFNLRCGILSLGSKSNLPAGRGTVIQDNILAEVSIGSGSAAIASESYNLFTWRARSGSNDLLGSPTYEGGASPGTYAGYKLVAGSVGKGNASDGADRGARIP